MDVAISTHTTNVPAPSAIDPDGRSTTATTTTTSRASSSSPSLPRVASNGAFVSARDSTFWLAVAVASSSSSASSFSSSMSAPSLSGSSLHLSGTLRSSLDLRAALQDPSTLSTTIPTLREGARSDRDLGLAIGKEDEDDDDDDDDDDGRDGGDDRATAMESPVAPMTSPPPPSEGLRKPTKLQNHRTRDRLGSDWRPSTSHSNTKFHESLPPSPPPRRQQMPSSLVHAPPTFEMAVEEIYEHQRYQMVLGWGAKGHLLPLDPAKFVRVVRTPLLEQQCPQLQSNPRAATSASDEAIQVYPSPTFPDVCLPDHTVPEKYKWEWISPWHLEYPHVSAATEKLHHGHHEEQEQERDQEQEQDQDSLDADGWAYASSFSHFPSWRDDTPASSSSPVRVATATSDTSTCTVCTSPLANVRGRPTLNVRRRKWIRYRRLRVFPTTTTCTSTIFSHAQAFASSLSASTNSSSPFDDSLLDSMTGWLRKLGHVRKNWKLRYFVLTKSVLRYYADESQSRLKGEVLLFHPATRVHYVDIHVSGGRDYAFAVQVGPAYALLLQAEKLSARENWMYCLEDALLCRDSYLQDPTRTQEVRESVARRRDLSAESVLFRGSGGMASAMASSSEALVQATRKNPLMMRLMVECDAWIESKQFQQQIASFVAKFRQKYGTSGSSGSSGSAPSSQSTTLSPVASGSSPASASGRRRTASYEGVASTTVRSSSSSSSTSTNPVSQLPDVSAIHDPRSLLALKSYRVFLERAMYETMEHLHQLPLVHASVHVTSPKSHHHTQATTAYDRGNGNGNGNGDHQRPSGDAAPPLSGDLDWALAKRAALYKLERHTFLPLQETIYALLESAVDTLDLATFDRNRFFLGRQSQSFFEIQASHLSPSLWKSARCVLESMDEYSLPSEKAAILVEVAKCIYETYSREQRLSSLHGELHAMAADDFLPILIFILARARLRNVVVARHLVSETMLSCVMMGETGYYATMLEAAVSYIASFGVDDAAAAQGHGGGGGGGGRGGRCE